MQKSTSQAHVIKCNVVTFRTISCIKFTKYKSLSIICTFNDKAELSLVTSKNCKHLVKLYNHIFGFYFPCQ